MKTYESIPVYDNRKSFYKKAFVAINENTHTLISYDTKVVSVENGLITRLWNGYIITTMRHINEFLRQEGLEVSGKRWWESLPCGEVM